MSPKVSAHSPGAGRPRYFRTLLALLYLGALSLLIVWEYHERLEVFSADCSLRNQAKSSLYETIYTRFQNWARQDTPGQVVTVAIPSDLEEVQSNLCLGRAYLADLLTVLARQHPGVIVLDKFFSPNACASDPATTREFLEAIQGISAPVILGESTNGLEKAVNGACLARKPQMEVPSPHVRHGLTRLNAEAERIPLRWLVLPEAPEEGKAPASHPTPVYADSLSLAAIQAYDPAFSARPGIQRLLAQDDHAFADVNIHLPRITSTQLLCSANDEQLRRRWNLACPSQPELPRMLGKIVLIGAENTSDLKTVMNRQMWGFELQARYIASLLEGDYLRSLPVAISVILFALFVFVVEGMPILMLGYVPGWKKKPFLRFAYPRRRYVWVLFWAFALIFASAFLSLAMRYLPPLLVYSDILLVMMTRLMYFSAESAEHPFLHAHHPRKARVMQKQVAPTPAASVPVEEIAPTPTPVAVTAAAMPNTRNIINKPGGEGGTAG